MKMKFIVIFNITTTIYFMQLSADWLILGEIDEHKGFKAYNILEKHAIQFLSKLVTYHKITSSFPKFLKPEYNLQTSYADCGEE